MRQRTAHAIPDHMRARAERRFAGVNARRKIYRMRRVTDGNNCSDNMMIARRCQQQRVAKLRRSCILYTGIKRYGSLFGEPSPNDTRSTSNDLKPVLQPAHGSCTRV